MKIRNIAHLRKLISFIHSAFIALMCVNLHSLQTSFYIQRCWFLHVYNNAIQCNVLRVFLLWMCYLQPSISMITQKTHQWHMILISRFSYKTDHDRFHILIQRAIEEPSSTSAFLDCLSLFFHFFQTFFLSLISIFFSLFTQRYFSRFIPPSLGFIWKNIPGVLLGSSKTWCLFSVP